VTYDQYKNAYNDLKNQGMKGMVVDLRSNPGGSLSIVCKILDEILPEGKIVYTQDKNGKEEDFTSDEEHQIDIPMTVLVNQYSASASEIFAGAIQDYDLGAIVGTQTYGKGVVQQIFDLKDGTCVKLTIAKYFTAKGQDIDGKGITPDVAIDYQADENNPEADNQLNKAIETLQGEMQ
jgi:carboxyl-terminal processing protease